MYLEKKTEGGHKFRVESKREGLERLVLKRLAPANQRARIARIAVGDVLRLKAQPQ